MEEMTGAASAKDDFPYVSTFRDLGQALGMEEEEVIERLAAAEGGW
jgi:DNA-binding Lrp family transcriptional regulator